MALRIPPFIAKPKAQGAGEALPKGPRALSRGKAPPTPRGVESAFETAATPAIEAARTARADAESALLALPQDDATAVALGRELAAAERTLLGFEQSHPSELPSQLLATSSALLQRALSLEPGNLSLGLISAARELLAETRTAFGPEHVVKQVENNLTPFLDYARPRLDGAVSERGLGDRVELAQLAGELWAHAVQLRGASLKATAHDTGRSTARDATWALKQELPGIEARAAETFLKLGEEPKPTFAKARVQLDRHGRPTNGYMRLRRPALELGREGLVLHLADRALLVRGAQDLPGLSVAKLEKELARHAPPPQDSSLLGSILQRAHDHLRTALWKSAAELPEEMAHHWAIGAGILRGAIGPLERGTGVATRGNLGSVLEALANGVHVSPVEAPKALGEALAVVENAQARLKAAESSTRSNGAAVARDASGAPAQREASIASGASARRATGVETESGRRKRFPFRLGSPARSAQARPPMDPDRAEVLDALVQARARIDDALSPRQSVAGMTTALSASAKHLQRVEESARLSAGSEPEVRELIDTAFYGRTLLSGEAGQGRQAEEALRSLGSSLDALRMRLDPAARQTVASAWQDLQHARTQAAAADAVRAANNAEDAQLLLRSLPALEEANPTLGALRELLAQTPEQHDVTLAPFIPLATVRPGTKLVLTRDGFRLQTAGALRQVKHAADLGPMTMQSLHALLSQASTVLSSAKGAPVGGASRSFSQAWAEALRLASPFQALRVTDGWITYGDAVVTCEKAGLFSDKPLTAAQRRSVAKLRADLAHLAYSLLQRDPGVDDLFERRLALHPPSAETGR